MGFFVCLSVLFLELTCSCLLRTRIGGWGKQILWFYSEGWSARQDMTGEKSTVWRPKTNLQWTSSSRESNVFPFKYFALLMRMGNQAQICHWKFYYSVLIMQSDKFHGDIFIQACHIFSPYSSVLYSGLLPGPSHWSPSSFQADTLLLSCQS